MEENLEKYYVNNVQTKNPTLHHEIHTEKHANELNIKNRAYLGSYNNCFDALKKAREMYGDADGCATCCLSCHRGVKYAKKRSYKYL